MFYQEVYPGNYDSAKLISYLSANPLISIYYTGISTDSVFKIDWYDIVEQGDISITQRYKWSFNSIYYFFLDMNKSSIKLNIGFNEINLEQPFKYKTNYRIFVSSQESLGNMVLSSPGLVVLEATKYVILRCPEIEAHVLGRYSGIKQTPGIAMLKLADANSLTNLRLDFTNIIRKNFHPIGKISRLTFYLYNNNGELYDFKGIDHNFLISIKYYAPRNDCKFSGISKLNPNYDPDILRYEMNQIKDEKKREYELDKLKKKQRKFLE